MRRLHWQFYLAILATMAVFAIASAIFWNVTSGTRSSEWGLAAVGRLAGTSLPPPDSAPDEQQHALERLSAQFEAELALYDRNGNRIASAGEIPMLTPKQLARADHHVITRGGPSMVVPLEDGRRLALRPHGQHPHGPRLFIVPISIVLALALGAYPIARRLTGRLARLQRGVEQLGGGNLTARVKVEGRDEVASLARSFNEAAARIEELVRSHKMLLANCSHELRTPLARIWVGIERASAGADPALREEMKRSLAELDALIEEMLLASRLDALQGIERSEPVDVLALAAEEAAHFDCEAQGESVTVHGDPALLRRMVRNLLDNARRYAGGATCIEVSRGQNGAAVIVIEDAGPGIPESEREKIFEPFYRSPSNGGAGRGFGLGLSIVRQIARAHRGSIAYETRNEGGSRFVVTLPAQVGE